MNENAALFSLLNILDPGTRLVVVRRLGPHECEAVATGTAAEIRAGRCAEMCGDSIVERVDLDTEGPPESEADAVWVFLAEI